jgi:hypothetical protein
MGKKDQFHEDEGQRHKRSADIHCRYCGHFIDIPSEYRFTNSRYCKTGGIEVDSDSEACKDFELSRTIWCQKNEQQTHPVACINRLKKNPDCRGCEQGLELYRFQEIPEPIINIIGE